MELIQTTSTPSISQFDPTIIPYQYTVLEDIRVNYDYSLGVHEVLLSGSVGSAKSLLMAHIGVTHCLHNPGATCLLARKAMPDLKDTILTKVLDHMEGDLTEGKDYVYNKSTGHINFTNGSTMLCRSWADKRYTKARSLELSCLLIEELTENNSTEFNAFYKEFRARVGRLPHVKENLVVCATNPDAPSHSAYEYFIKTKVKTRHVYYSVTTDNPFLPKWYIKQLLETYTKQESRRMIYGEWIEIKSEVIYYAFDEDLSVIEKYEVDENYPIYITYDFNIGLGKPMSACLFQYIGGEFFIFDEVVIYGSNTLETTEDMIARGLIDYLVKYIVQGDASGRSKSSKYNRSDYDIIKKALSNYEKPGGHQTQVEIDVPLSNPPVRKRHIILNGQLKNSYGITKVFVVRDKCPTVIKGLRMAKLKKGGQYIEDDSDYFQHISTALGYAVLRILNKLDKEDNFSQKDYHGNKITERRRSSQSRFSQNGDRRN